MGEWRNYHIYYTNLDKLIIECVHPLLLRRDSELENCFWERHYAGGPHLRVRLKGDDPGVDEVGAELIRETRQFLASHPSTPIDNYSPEAVKKLLSWEDEGVEDEDLVYRLDEILERPYQRVEHRLASDEAAALLEDFLHDSMPLTIAILKSERPKMVEVLRLYFLEALFVSGNLPGGCVSFKSHWEGLAAFFASRHGLNERIKENYLKKRDTIIELMLEVKGAYDSGSIEKDPILRHWHDLMQRNRARTKAILDSGQHVTKQATNLEEARWSKQYMEERKLEHNPFLNTLWSDERFMASIQYEYSMLWPRVLTNLLYSLAAVVGLKLIDKMTLCYYAHRAAEDYFECDLTDILKETVKEIIDKNKHRFPSSDAR